MKLDDVTATWNTGVPATAAPESPVLTITVDEKGAVYQHVASTTDTLDNTFVPPKGGSSVTCSFAGGCEITINASGLTTNVLNGKQQVQVGGFEAKILKDSSDSSTAVFSAPEVRTIASQQSAGNDESVLLPAENEIASDDSYKGVLFNGENLPGIQGTTANCYIGNTFSNDQIGVLDEFRFFMDFFKDKSKYAGTLVFQGSNDGFITDINDLQTVYEELHEGFNTYEFEYTKPAYKSYRLFNPTAGGCDQIGELKLFGQ